jgi:hypothetical protein
MSTEVERAMLGCWNGHNSRVPQLGQENAGSVSAIKCLNIEATIQLG